MHMSAEEKQLLVAHYTAGESAAEICANARVAKSISIVQSFSKSGQPHDNAVAEPFFAAIKCEELYRTQYKFERQFRESIDNYRGCFSFLGLEFHAF